MEVKEPVNVSVQNSKNTARPVTQCPVVGNGGGVQGGGVCSSVGGTSSKVLLAYRNATQHLNNAPGALSNISKAGMQGILKLATSQWKHQERKARARSSSVGNRCSATLVTNNTTTTTTTTARTSPCKRSALDQLAALVLNGQSRLQQQPQLTQQDSSPSCSSTKPQNCRRIVVLGAPRVGKTSILRRFLRDGFDELYEPTSEDFHRKMYHIRGEAYQIDILDASGERSFPAKRRLSILTGNVFLLVFSVDDRNSFEEVRALRTEIVAAKTALQKSKERARVPTVVCANKADLPEHQWAISRDEIREVLGEGCAFFETSAKDNLNLEQVFEALAQRGGLPLETGPSQHRKVSIRSYQALRASRQPGRGVVGGKTAGTDIPCGALYPLARRPSFSTDLRLVLGSHASGKQNKPLERCQIQ